MLFCGRYGIITMYRHAKGFAVPVRELLYITLRQGGLNMGGISNVTTGLAAYGYAGVQTKKPVGKTEKAESASAAAKSSAAKETDSSRRLYTAGTTVGEPKLSEKAESYYEELKKKHGNMDFILVSSDMKDTAKSLAGSFANPYKPVVLIDEDKIEKMASDEKYREKYENLIEQGASKMDDFKKQLASSGAQTANYGMQVKDDGTVSYFATMSKSFDDTRTKLAAKRAEKKELEKAEAKKAEKKEASEKLEEKRAETDELEELSEDEAKEILGSFETLESDSIEGLLRKVQDFSQNVLTDRTKTVAERAVGSKFDFSL